MEQVINNNVVPVRANALPILAGYTGAEQILILSNGVLYNGTLSGLLSYLQVDDFSIMAAIAAAPVLANETAAIAADLPANTFYKTATGELRYKLPAVVPPTPGGFPYTLPITF